MLPLFDDEDTYEYVVTNTNKIADMIGDDIIVTKEGIISTFNWKRR